MALSRQMINFRGAHLREDAPQRRTIGKIAVMQEELFSIQSFVPAQMFNPRPKKIARPSHDSVDGIFFFRQLGQINCLDR